MSVTLENVINNLDGRLESIENWGGSAVIARRYTVTVSGKMNTSFTIPATEGETFLCAVGVASNNFVGSPYIEVPTSRSSTIWDNNYHAQSGTVYSYTITYLNKKDMT